MSGYMEVHPGNFDSPADVIFPKDIGGCDEEGCQEAVAFVMCPYCSKSYCFVHYVAYYHWCQE